MDSGVLFVSPYAQDVASLKRMLVEDRLSLEHAASLGEAVAKLKTKRFYAILTEAELGDGTWRDVLDMVRQLPVRTEVVVTHPWADARFWAEAIDLGAFDLLAQPFQSFEVRRVLKCACASRNQSASASAK